MTPQYRIEQYLNAINAAYLGETTLPEYPAEPVWRIEGFLAAILSAVKGDSPVMACPDPVWHIEEFARAIYDALVGASPAWPCPTATNNIEAILHAIYKVVADGTETDGIATSWDIERWLLDSYDAAKQGGGGTKTTLSGNLPLTLANALSHAIVSLTRYGLCTQDGTPTPDAPVDIVCNNGALKWDSVNQRVYADGTPEVLTVSGANLLNPATNITGKYITANGSIRNGDDAQYTDLIPVKAGETYVASFVSGRNSGNNRWHGYNANGTWVKQLAYVSASEQQGNKLIMTATIDSGISYVRLSYGITDTEAMISMGRPISVDGYYLGAHSSTKAIAYRNTPIQSPYTSTSAYRGPAVVFSVLPGKIYAAKGNAVTNGTNINYTCYQSIEDVADSSKSIGSWGAGSSFVAPNGANYAVVAYVNSSSGTTFTFDEPNVVEINSEYQPYVAPQTASVPSLFALDNRKDEADIISGAVTRQTGIKVLDGTENWVENPGLQFFTVYGYLNSYTPTPTKAPQNFMPLSTHFSRKSGRITPRLDTVGADLRLYYSEEFSDLATWKAWLAAQYAAGTPVIIVYKLNGTEVTEQVPAQHLVTNEGTNVVDSVANVSPLAAEVKYMKGGNEA